MRELLHLCSEDLPQGDESRAPTGTVRAPARRLLFRHEAELVRVGFTRMLPTDEGCTYLDLVEHERRLERAMRP